MTKDHNAPFRCNIESEGKKNGHGTEIRAEVQRNLLTESEIKELIGSKFAVDPAFTILVNNDSVQLLNLKHLVTTPIQVEPFGEIVIHRIDSEVQDRTTHCAALHGGFKGESLAIHLGKVWTARALIWTVAPPLPNDSASLLKLTYSRKV